MESSNVCVDKIKTANPNGSPLQEPFSPFLISKTFPSHRYHTPYKAPIRRKPPSNNDAYIRRPFRVSKTNVKKIPSTSRPVSGQKSVRRKTPWFPFQTMSTLFRSACTGMFSPAISRIHVTRVMYSHHVVVRVLLFSTG